MARFRIQRMSGENRGSFVLIVCCFGAFVLLYQAQFGKPNTVNRPPFSPNTVFQPQPGYFDGQWNVTRDSNNLLLSNSQCDAAFPELFAETERPLELRRNNHITLKEIDKIVPRNGYMRCLLYDQQLYVIATEGAIYSRGLATLHAIHRAVLTSPETLPNIEFSFNVDDKISSEAQWAYTRRAQDKELWLMPDFGLWSWPETKIGSYGEVQLKAKLLDQTKPWRDKVGKVLWRGATMGLALRENMVAATKGKDWADVAVLDWHNKESMTNDLKSTDQHCEYKYLMHTEGNSYSGRLKYLQNCRSVVIAHDLEWIQHHHHLMKSSGPDQNYVEVSRKFDNLESTVRWLKENEGAAEFIADRQVKVLRDRYLTPAAETCYWRKLIRAWAEVSFEPELFKEIDGKRVLRGVSLESYLLERRLEWEPY